MSRDAGSPHFAGALAAEVLAGPWGMIAQQAAADRAAIVGAMAAVPASERARFPELVPIVDELQHRVLALSPTLHHLDAALMPNALAASEARIAAARLEPESPAREQRLALLERQRATLRELTERRNTLARQLESVMLALAQLRYETLRLRTGGISRALADAESVTRQVRALSADLARAANSIDTAGGATRRRTGR